MKVEEKLTKESFFGFTGNKLVEKKTKYQKLEIWETKEFGKVLRLDDKFMTSEKDEFYYHEIFAHPAAFTVKEPKNVLIIGGGDGGLAKQLLKHSSIEKIIIAELDEEVINVSKEYLLKVHENSFDDKRVTVVIGDGLELIENHKELFDLIYYDLTDLDTPAKDLYDKKCLEKISKKLNRNGCLTLHLGASIHHESMHEKIKELLRDIQDVFKSSSFYGAYVPLYGSYWPMVVASNGVSAKYLTEASIERKMNENFKSLNYYSPNIHKAIFTLPPFYLKMINETK